MSGSFKLSGKSVLLWVISVGVAFTAGRWLPLPFWEETDSTPASAGQINPKEPRELSAQKSSAVTGIVTNQSESSEPNASDATKNQKTLSLVLEGDASSLEWRRAALEAETMSPDDSRYWFEALLRTPASPERDRLLGVLLGRLGGTVPVEALQLASGISSVSASESARNQILQSWAQRDPTAALAWVEETRGSVPNRMTRSRMESWMDGFSTVDPSGAFAYVVGMDEATQADRRLKRDLIEIAVGKQVADGRVDEVLRQMELLPEGRVRTEALQEFYSEWAKQDPVNAARHFLENREEGSETNAAGLIREWASSDPEAAAAFVANLEASDPAYSVAISSLIERWTRYDLDRPAEWLNQLPPSEEIDRAVAVFSLRAAEGDPAGAMSWAASISSEETRNRVMQRVAADWKESDPAGLEAYITENQLDEETATGLREARQGRRWWGGF